MGNLKAVEVKKEMSGWDKLIHSEVINVYESNGRSVSRTSRELGLHRSVIYRHLRFAGIAGMGVEQ